MTWITAPHGKITDHFGWAEAKCRHCGKIPDEESVTKTAEWMERVRQALGNRPLHVNSWCRCPSHNAAIGASTNSYHMKGMAVDITVRDMTPAQVHARLKTFQGEGKLIGGLGRYISFTHVDRGPVRSWDGP
jgi:uncharacterized protein YcbK (DUF882 family)